MLIRDYLDDNNSFLDVNTRLKKVESMLISAAKRSLKIRKPKRRKKNEASHPIKNGLIKTVVSKDTR